MGKKLKSRGLSATACKQVVRNAMIHMACFHPFKRFFGKSLDDYWRDNYYGFNLDKFSNELKTTPLKLLIVVKKKWGNPGTAFIKILTGNIKDEQTIRNQLRLAGVPIGMIVEPKVEESEDNEELEDK